jgi:hypothetical protein
LFELLDEEDEEDEEEPLVPLLVDDELFDAGVIVMTVAI